MSSSGTVGNNPPDRFKLAIVGTGSVGKSAITIQFTQNVFDTDEVYDPTIEDAYYVKRMIDGVGCELEIIDTAGQDDYIALRDTWMKGCYGFILVFDLTSVKSLEELKIFSEQIKRTKYDENKPLANGNIFPGIILGNKCDLNFKLSEKEVAAFMKKELEVQLPILFTSAKSRINIDEAFEAVIREMRSFKTAQAKASTNDTEKKKGIFSSISNSNQSEKDLQDFKGIE